MNVLNDMVYIPADAVDFGEDTSDGKRTLHTIAMAIYQKCEPEDQELKLNLIGSAQIRSNKELSWSMPELLHCPKAVAKPQNPVYPSFSLMMDDELILFPSLPDFTWLLGRTMTVEADESTRITDLVEMTVNEDDLINNASRPSELHVNIPTWSAYHSLISPLAHQTRVRTTPLIAAPAHEWQTLLTRLLLAQRITAKVIGPDRKKLCLN